MPSHFIFTNQKFWKHLGLLLLLALAGYASIFFSDVIYFDDSMRIYTHTAINQGVNGRPMADVAYGLLSEGLFVDMSPLSRIYALCFMIFGGMLVARVFAGIRGSNNDVGPSALAWWAPLLFVLLPLNFAVLTFRFDSFSMGLAILCACGAFHQTFRGGGTIWGCIATAGLLWLAMSLYQPMAGIYYVCCASYMALLSLRGTAREIFGSALRIAGASLLAAVAYLPVYSQAIQNAGQPFCGLPNHPYVLNHSGLAGRNIAEILLENIGDFLRTVKSYGHGNALTACVLCIALAAVGSVLLSRATAARKITSLACLAAAFVACGSINLLLANTMFPPRCMIGLCAFVLCLALLADAAATAFIRRILIAACAVCILCSAGILTAYGNAERDQDEFEEQMILQPLWQDMAALLEKRRGDGREYAFFVENDMPLHYTLKKLNASFLPIGAQTGNFLCVAMRLLSWLPLKYDLAGNFSEHDAAAYPLLVSRLTYEIRQFSPDVFMIVFKHEYVPEYVPPFESARYFGSAARN